jgi:hypothetical protein
MDIWVIFAFLSGLVVGFWSHIVIVEAIKRQAVAIVNARNSQIGVQKKEVIKSEKVAMMGELKEVLDGQGEMKDKMSKLVAVAAQHPEATEDLFKTFRKFI